MHLPDPSFPPLLTGHAVRAPERAFAAAISGAVSGKLGAGDFVWARNTERLECALVLEPDVPPDRSAEMIFVTLVAFGDCFGALSPPEASLTFGWPVTILVNGARVGQVRAAMSGETDEDGAPRWLVVGVEVELKATTRGSEPGNTPDVTNLDEEGCGDITRTELIESFSRHLLTWIHLWEIEGFREVHDAMMFRTNGLNEEVAIEIGGVRHAGRFTGLDEHGNLVLASADGVRLVEAIKAFEIVDAAELAP